MANIIYFHKLNLQLFADGAGAGDGGTGASGQGVTETAALSQNKGVKSNPLADVKYGKQEVASAAEVQTEETTVDRRAEFEKLIKGEYKDLYGEKVQDTIQKRFKEAEKDRVVVEKFNALMPTLETLAKKYGVDASDIKALNKAIEEDDSYFEDEALEKGMSVEQLKTVRKMERENAELRRQMQEKESKENANRLYKAWMDQASNTKSVYPSFNLDAEMQNPKFVQLLRSNVDVRTAYEVLHKDEIIPAAMQFTAKTVEQKIANNIASGSRRPSENGMHSQSAATVKDDVSRLTKADRDEIIRRVQRGEKIVF